MNDDQLLQDLARVATEEMERERSRLDPHWERLCAGELAADEEAELSALAAASDEAREAYEAFRPLDADFRARVVLALRDQARGERPAPATEPGETGQRARVLPFARRRLWLGGSIAAAAAVAAIVLLVPGPAPLLPRYVATLEGGVREIRSASPAGEAAVRAFAPGGRFELVLTPATGVVGQVEARLFLERSGELRGLEVHPEISESGAVRIVGEIGREVPITPGDWTLWAVVGRRGKLPGAGELRSYLGVGEARQRHWVLARLAVRIEEER